MSLLEYVYDTYFRLGQEHIDYVLQEQAKQGYINLLLPDLASRIPWVGLPDPDPEFIIPQEDNIISVYIGKTEHLKMPVFWMPLSLMNPHLLGVGTTGAGKTTLVETMTVRMAREGVPNILFIDFVGEYERFVEYFMKGKVVRLGTEGNNINLLDLASTHPRLRVEQTLSALSSELNLDNAPRQRNILRRAISKAYSDAGIPISNKNTSRQFWAKYNKLSPTMKDVSNIIRDMMKEEDAGKFMVGKGGKESGEGMLDKLEKYNNPPYDSITCKSTINLEKILMNPGVLSIDLSGFPTEDMKTMTAVMLLHLQEQFMRTFPSNTGKIRTFIVIDEAWKLLKLKENNPLSVMAREARKYGLALLILSQRLKDSDNDLFSLFGTYIVLNLTEAEDLNYLKDSLNLTSREVDRIRNMKRGDAIISEKVSQQGQVRFGMTVDPILSTDLIEIVFPEVPDLDSIVKEVSKIY